MTKNNDIAKAEDTVVFCSGEDVFNTIINEGYIQHKTGLFILAPSGAGKTYFVTRQQKMDWIDGDDLWPVSGADDTDPSWNYDMNEVMELNLRCDIITLQAKKVGLWIIGSSNICLKPDAIVLPKWGLHRAYVSERQKKNYGDGATTEDINGLKEHRRWIRKWIKYGVKCFNTIEEAVDYCKDIKITSYEIKDRT